MSTKLFVPATNIPRCGTITGVSYAPSRKAGWDDQVKIEGMWEQEGPGHFYQSLNVAEAYTDAGVVRQEGVTSDGKPRFVVVNPAQRVMIVRNEIAGSNAKTTKVTPIDMQGNTVALPACPKPVFPEQPVAQTAPAAPPTTPAPATAPPPNAPPPTGPPQTPPTMPPAATESDVDDPEHMRKRWAELDERYAACVAIAAYRLREGLGVSDVNYAVIQGGAATLMEQSEREGLTALPGLAKRLRARMNGNGGTQRTSDPGLTDDEIRAPERTPANAGRRTGDGPDDDLPF